MFKKYPYWGWLSVAMLLWLFSCIRFYQLRQMATPKAMTALVSKDFQNRQKALDQFLANEALIKKIFNDSLASGEADALSKEPFYIYAFKGSYLLQFWNSNMVIGTCNKDFPEDHTNGLYRYNGTYYKQCLHPSFLKPYEHLVVLFPLRYKYAIQNKYLQSTFLAADYIPLSTSSSLQKLNADSYPVVTADERVLFYLNYITDDLPDFIPDTLLGGLFLLALLASMLWVHLVAVALSRNRSPLFGFIVIAAAILTMILVVYGYGAPFHFNELLIFRPYLYASSFIFPHLAALLTVLVGTFWMLCFVLFNFKRPEQAPRNKIVSFVLVVSIVLVLIANALVPTCFIEQLVMDSKISFQVIDLDTINFYTPGGLIIVVIILCCNTFIIYYSNLHLNNIIRKKGIKYLVLLSCLGVGSLLFYRVAHTYQLLYAASVILFILLFDFFFRAKRIKIFSAETIVIGVIMAVSATLLLHYFNETKQRSDQKLFAEKIVKQQDEMMEFLFSDIGDSLRKDPVVRDYLLFSNREDRTYIDEHIATRYFRGQLNRYEIKTYLYDANNLPVYNTDTFSIAALDTLLSKGLPVDAASYLYYFENAKDGRYYIAKIPVDTNAGAIALSFRLKQDVNSSVYPELLEPGKLLEEGQGKKYTYAIYANKELITQNNDYPFPYYLRSDTMATGDMRVLDREGYRVNIYKIEDGKRVSIMVEEEQWTEMITLFSYTLCILLAGALAVFLFSIFLKYVFKKSSDHKIIELTLRNRIHFAILSVVLLSFVVIGTVTILVFVDRYDTTNKMKLRKAMQGVERSLQLYFKDRKMLLDESIFHEETQTPRFKNYISSLANSEGLDINIYNSEGTLNATSQEDIYNKALLARIMMPDAYFEMSQNQKALLVQNEHIGGLQYLSSYVPMRTLDGQAVGYINVPFFSSQNQLNYQISNILVALINIYALVFIISSLLAVGITTWLTKGLQVLIEKFKTINLNENEKIVWKHDDEIGLLLREYNKMVEKVVENAKQLARSERESAWREMAKQVAHEIKNPLTPMKLNIQYLQQALEKKHPNLEQLTANVSASLIEQIDNLSHIASAFSDFAKMPEATPENISLNELLRNAVDLYNNGNSLNVQYEGVEETLVTFLDKSQLVRVFTNLLKNAAEAIPEDRQAQVKVSLKKEGDTAQISIQDNGRGISEEVAAHIFSPYFTTKGSGTGLGLAMTKKIVEFWNGKIWFETKENVGTTFFIELPLNNAS